MPRRNGRRICSGCGEVRPGYDMLPESRRFEFVPLWGITVYFVYQMRRVQCPDCGVTVEQVPWAEGKSSLTTEYKWFLARWARRMSWTDVLDRFQVMQRIGKAINDVRAAEVKQLKADGYEPVLKGARWLLLKRPENLTDKQAVKLQELLEYNLKSIRSHLMKEDFQQFWEYTSPYSAGRFLDQWCTRALRSRIGPMKKVARSLRQKRELILNWFRAGGTIWAGIVEGFNNKLKLTTRKSYGFRTQEAYEIALYHNLGSLPQPEFTHRFC